MKHLLFVGRNQMLKADRKPADHNVKSVLKFWQNTLYCEIPKVLFTKCQPF